MHCSVSNLAIGLFLVLDAAISTLSLLTLGQMLETIRGFKPKPFLKGSFVWTHVGMRTGWAGCLGWLMFWVGVFVCASGRKAMHPVQKQVLQRLGGKTKK